MATRPILLHVFRVKNEARASATPGSFPLSEGAQKIAQTCVQCARHSFRLLSEAWVQGKFAVFDYFYTQYLFSAATILALSALFDGKICRIDLDDFDTASDILSQLSLNGNFGAREFCLHISAIKLSMEASSLIAREDLYSTPVGQNMTEATQQFVLPYTSPMMTAGMALAEPTLQEFLAQSDRSFQLTNATGLDEIQTPFFPDLWVGDWMKN
jgi:proline utilization trans-activator